MADSTEPGKISEGPAMKRETWFANALASMIVTVIAGAFAAVWVFSADMPTLMVQRAQAFTPFGAALLAIVTFCTVAWRGVLNTEQLERQADQLQQQIRQNDAKDEENLAKLLLDGTKLMGAEEEAHVLAGIAVLQAVATAQNGRFATEAMNILLGAGGDYCTDNEKKVLYEACAAALAGAVSMNRFGTRELVLTAPSDGFSWPDIHGAQRVSLSGGRISGFTSKSLPEKLLKNNKNVSIKRVKISFAKIKKEINFSECEFERCTIEAFNPYFIRNNIFKKCDFSNAKDWGEFFLSDVYDEEEIRKNIGGKGNYYVVESPPQSERIDMTKFLVRETSRHS